MPSLIPGQIVVLDNLAFHKCARAITAIESVGCTVCLLPPSSPNFHPIELAFSKLKQHPRTTQARSFATVAAATGPALDAFTPADAAAFFAHRGSG